MRGGQSCQLMLVSLLYLIIICLGTDQLRIVEFKSFPNEIDLGLGLKNVQLLCTVKGQADRLLTVTIERPLPARPPQTLVYKQSRSEVKVFYDIAILTCQDMGVYRCQATMEDTHQPVYTNISLNFYDCPPLPCPGEGNYKTVSAAIKETKTVYFCMQAFPELTKVIKVRRGSLNETRLRSDIEDYQLKWSYDPLPDLLSYFNVSVTVYNISQSNYTDLRLMLMTTQGLWYDVELIVSIRPNEKPSIVFKSSPDKVFNQSDWGQAVALECSVGNQTDQRFNVTIERLLPARSPQILVTSASEVNVNYNIASLTCEDMGVYRCQTTMEDTHQPMHQNFSLKLYDCNPLPCPGEANSKIVYAAINETKTVYFCMQAFPNISTYANIRWQSYKETLMADLEDYQLEWTYHPLLDIFSYYNVSVTVYNISPSNYTDLRLRLVTTQGTQYGADLTIKIRQLGSPQCPTDLQLTTVGKTHVLTWTPGMDGGSSQWFVVFYTSNGTWTQHQVTEGLTSLNITDLQDNVQYHVTVVAVNSFTNHFVYPTTCRNNIMPYTATGPPDCPTDLNMTSTEGVHVLSWAPGSSGSSSQWFEVFYNSNNVTWTQRHVTSGQTSVNFTDLQENTEYHVTVSSTNNHTSKIVNETSCQNNTISYRVPVSALESAAATTSKLDMMEVALICLVVAVVVVVVIVIGMVIAKRGLYAPQRPHQFRHKRFTQQGKQPVMGNVTGNLTGEVHDARGYFRRWEGVLDTTGPL